MKLIILITGKVEAGFEVAEAWREKGAPGVTILRGHGIETLREQIKHGDVEIEPMMYSMAKALASLLEHQDENVLLFLSVINPETVDPLIDVTTAILGDLTQPHTGVIFAIDVERAVGVYHHGQNQ